jgi:propionyl-CoA carboxylase beta chain
MPVPRFQRALWRRTRRRSQGTEARRELIADYRAQFASPFNAAELGFIDEVIEPRLVRRRLSECLELTGVCCVR